jgi:hypothetical protein
MRIFLLLPALWLGLVAARAAGAATNVVTVPPGAPAPVVVAAPALVAPDSTDPLNLTDDFQPAAGQPLKRFDGRQSLTTADFAVPDGWEIRWHSDQVLSVGVIRRDKTVVAGTTGKTVGSLYVPQGGTYRLRVKGDDSVSWDIVVYAMKDAPADDVFYAPSIGPVFKPIAPGKAPPVATVIKPKPAPPAAPSLPDELTAQQRLSIVTIKGDRAAGAGFFMKHGPDTVLVTTQQLIANNPNWQAFSANGTHVQVTEIQGASDRDVALLSVKNFDFPALKEGDPMKLQPGDKLLTASAGGVALAPVYVGSLNQRRVMIDELRPVAGSPLVLASSGRVVGVIGVGPQVLPSENFDSDNFNERDAATTGSISAYGERFDNVPQWETCEQAQLQVEMQFLDSFHQQTRNLDAYLNGGGEFGSTQLWQADPKIKSANGSFVQESAGAGASQRAQALQGLLFELGVVADSDMDQIQQPKNFYSYPRMLAQDEIVYRKALKNELDEFGSDVNRFDGVASRNN